jgi:hypothetical protein
VYDDQMKEDDIGGACSMHTKFWSENLMRPLGRPRHR